MGDLFWVKKSASFILKGYPQGSGRNLFEMWHEPFDPYKKRGGLSRQKKERTAGKKRIPPI
jgi:hypothetical protein